MERATKIFLDSGDPQQTSTILDVLGFLDGQTTNPSLIAKSPGAQERTAAGNPFSTEELLAFYKETVMQIRSLVPTGSISIEVYADATTTAAEMIAQAEQMNQWIAGAHIKLPTTTAGLEAASQLVKQGMNVNMTLVFTEEQAAAVYSATQGAERGQVYLSPFIGRLDDKGQDGMSLIHNIIELYNDGDGHVEILAASLRNMNHLHACLGAGVDIATVPFTLLKEWAGEGAEVDSSFEYDAGDLAPIEKKELDLSAPWDSFDIQHDLTDAGLQRFADDWNALLS